ncbi:hypothetical protein [Bacteroides sedimenti]|uniref:Uncharacterized protein n=1 Tax=Bacteroides sedimenti TaxID=2136147 RepID=A0ABN6Z9U9_9BACE
MKCINIIITILLVAILFLSYYKSIKSGLTTDNSMTLKVNTSIKLRDDIRSIIEECINKYSQYDSFVLSRSPRKLVADDSDELLNNDFLIGPAFEHFDHDKTPLLFFEFKGKIIFIKCGLEELYVTSHHQDSIYQKKIVKRGVDSIVDYKGWVQKNGSILYIYRSIYFKICEDSSIYKNYRPDTLFLPKHSYSTIKFDPNIK